MQFFRETDGISGSAGLAARWLSPPQSPSSPEIEIGVDGAGGRLSGRSPLPSPSSASPSDLVGSLQCGHLTELAPAVVDGAVSRPWAGRSDQSVIRRRDIERERRCPARFGNVEHRGDRLTAGSAPRAGPGRSAKLLPIGEHSPRQLTCAHSHNLMAPRVQLLDLLGAGCASAIACPSRC